MEWIGKINSFFQGLGMPKTLAAPCSFLVLVAVFYLAAGMALKVLYKKKKIDAATRSFYFFVSPWIFGFLVFTLGPMLYSFTMSFFDWELVTDPVFAGAKNYAKMTSDKHVAKALSVTFKYTFIAVPLQVVLAFMIAFLLNTKLKTINLFRTFFYLPNLIQGVPQMVLFLWVFNPNIGLINSVLAVFGIKGPGWFSDPDWSLPAVILMSMWTVGGNMIIYLAGFQDISRSLYEQASIDGANGVRQFFHITIPQMTPIIFFNMITAMIGAFQTFTQGYMVSGGVKDSVLFYAYYLYQNAFMWFKMGYGCALAWVLFVIIMIFTMLVFRSSNLWVYYETEMMASKKKRKPKEHNS